MSEFIELYARFNQAIREVGKANGVLVIDLAALIPQDKQYMYDVVHLNTRGSQLAAQLISERLQPLVPRLGLGTGEELIPDPAPDPRALYPLRLRGKYHQMDARSKKSPSCSSSNRSGARAPKWCWWRRRRA